MNTTEIKTIYDFHYNLRTEQYKYQPITEEEFKIVSEYAHKVADLRHGKGGYKGTSKTKLINALIEGGCGEVAVSKETGHKVDDLEFIVSGKASDFAHADLKCIGYDCGVKTSRYGLPPMIVNKQNFYTERCGREVICTIKDDDIIKDDDGKITAIKGVWINGIGSSEVLKICQSRDLIMFQSCSKYSDRCGFYGFEMLEPIQNIKKYAV